MVVYYVMCAGGIPGPCVTEALSSERMASIQSHTEQESTLPGTKPLGEYTGPNRSLQLIQCENGGSASYSRQA